MIPGVGFSGCYSDLGELLAEVAKLTGREYLALFEESKTIVEFEIIRELRQDEDGGINFYYFVDGYLILQRKGSNLFFVYTQSGQYVGGPYFEFKDAFKRARSASALSSSASNKL